MAKLASRSLIATLALAQVAGVARSAERPHIILCMTDDQGWGGTGYNGNKTLKTSELDAMAAAGLRFNRFSAGAPLCSPTPGSEVSVERGVTGQNYVLR